MIRHRRRFPGENPFYSSGKHYQLSAFLFEIVEHLATGWPFCKHWGEELILTAGKNEQIGNS